MRFYWVAPFTSVVAYLPNVSAFSIIGHISTKFDDTHEWAVISLVSRKVLRIYDVREWAEDCAQQLEKVYTRRNNVDA